MSPTRVLTASEVRTVLSPDLCLDIVESALRADAEGKTIEAAVLGTHVPGGGFHVKTAGLQLSRLYYAAKINANFPGNPAKHGLPTIQGVIALYDGTDGQLLALLDSGEITTLRTAAMTAAAAKYLSREDSNCIAMLGCGIQARAHLNALARLRNFTKAYVWDINGENAKYFAREMSDTLHFEVNAVSDYKQVTRDCDVVITCTPSKQPILDVADVSPGTFVGAVGTDNEEKSEITPALMAQSKVVVDVLDQCARIGDLHHAIDAGVMRKEDVYTTLPKVVAAGTNASNPGEIMLFDSTGTALADVAAAAAVYEAALQSGAGVEVLLRD
ncbi:MAG TPA: ornithine cyclodeaminase family protein [Longimicrobiales bacterium]|nr:ornithine cyclodeaminase family protein [Longimicrobiales bacterium]